MVIASNLRAARALEEQVLREVVYDVDDRRASITITDQGRGFDPGQVADPTADENLEKPCGRGIMLMRAYMDEVQFRRGGQQVRLIKRNRGKQ